MNIRRGIGITVIAAALPSCGFPVFGQAAAAGGWPPPKVLQIYREEVKPGKAPAHEVVEAGWPRAFAKANWPTHYIAMTSLTGPNEAWFMTGFDSFAAWEADTRNIDKNPGLKKELDQLEAKDGELRSGGRSVVASFREDLSNQWNVDMPKMRYFRVITFRVGELGLVTRRGEDREGGVREGEPDSTLGHVPDFLGHGGSAVPALHSHEVARRGGRLGQPFEDASGGRGGGERQEAPDD